MQRLVSSPVDLVLAPAGHPDLGAWVGHGHDVVVTGRSASHRWLAVAEAVEALPPVSSVWLPAPDVRADARTVSLLFALHHELGAGLTQPALAPGSVLGAGDEVARPGFSVRFTDPSGLSAPVLSGRLLPDAAAAMRAAPDGAGLPELLWAVLAAHGSRSALADCITVHRADPPAEPPLVDGCHPGRSAMALATRLGVPVPRTPALHGGLDEQFRPLGRSAAMDLALGGSR